MNSKNIVLYLHLHQPLRIKQYDFFSINEDQKYFNSTEDSLHNNPKVLARIVEHSYLPTLKILNHLLASNKGFHFSLSISGVLIDQLVENHPEVIKQINKAIRSNRVELVGSTYYHSLASLFSPIEFTRQIKLQQSRLREIFGFKALSFRNTELIYNDDLAALVEKLGYKSILAEGVDRYLGWRSPNYIYAPEGCSQIKLLLKNYQLSDDIAFRFQDMSKTQAIKAAKDFASKIAKQPGEIVNLFMDFETFGEHHKDHSGIFTFLKSLPDAAKEHNIGFQTITAAAKTHDVRDQVSMPEFTSWADTQRDVSAWQGNQLQTQAAQALFGLENRIFETQNNSLVKDWRCLSTSDHFYYMSDKDSDDGQVHNYFSPTKDSLAAFNYFMNTVQDLRIRLENQENNAA